MRAYMAHHIGMTLVSLTNVLLHDIWQARFHADSLVKSVELLLHERIPRRLVMQDVQAVLPDEARQTTESDRPVVREINTSLPSPPRIASALAEVPRPPSPPVPMVSRYTPGDR